MISSYDLSKENILLLLSTIFVCGSDLSFHNKPFHIFPTKIRGYRGILYFIFIPSFPYGLSFFFLFSFFLISTDSIGISPKVEGDEWRKASTDVVIAGLGWISITGEFVVAGYVTVTCNDLLCVWIEACECGVVWCDVIFPSESGFSFMTTL